MGVTRGNIVIQEIIYRKRGVELYKEVVIPSEIIPPYEIRPPTWFKPSLPVEFPHPLVQFGVRVEDETPIAWFKTTLFKRKFFFKD